MKSIFLLLVLTCSIVGVFGQSIRVLDQETGLALEFVSISNESSLAFLSTNSKGMANVSSLKCSDSLLFSLLGYKNKRISCRQLAKNGLVVYLSASSFELDKIVISATRWKQSAGNRPERIRGISKKETTFLSPQTAADLLGASGEVFIQKSQQGGGSPMIRGFASNRLLYVVDGVRMNTAIFRSGNIQNVISLDPFAMENVEVLFGPGSVIYGSDAIGGVMSFQTLQPQYSSSDSALVGASILSRFSSASLEETVHADLKYAWKRWAFVSSFSRSRFGDLKMGIDGPNDYLRPSFADQFEGRDIVSKNPDERKQIPTAYSQNNVMQKARFKANKNLDIEYGFHYSESSNIDRYDRHLQEAQGLPRYGDWYYGPQVWMMNSLLFSSSKKRKYWDQSAIRLSYQLFKESRNSRLFGVDNLEIRSERVKAYSSNFDFQKTINRHILSYGFEFLLNEVNSVGYRRNVLSNEQVPGPSRYPNSTWYSAALYLSDSYSIRENITIQTGLRYNHTGLKSEFDTQFYPLPFQNLEQNSGALTGSLGFVYRPASSWVFSSNASTGFRAPNVDDVGKVFDSEPGSVVVPNPSLKSEYAYNIDLGLAHVFSNRIKLDASAYYTWLNNAMVRRDFLLNGMDSLVYDGVESKVQAIQNAANAWVCGIQFGVEARLPYHFNLSSSFNFQKGEEELDNGQKSPSRHVAPWFGTLRLSFEKNKWQAQAFLIANGEIKANDLNVGEAAKPEIYAKNALGQPYSPSWYTLNLKAAYQVNQVLNVNLGCENLSNQRYRPYSSGIAAAGINYTVSIRLDF